MKIGEQVEADWTQHKNGGGWIHKNAKVEASCYIEGIIFSGTVSGDAQVYGDAQVSGDAWKKSPLFIVGSRFSLTNAKKGHIQIGCHCFTFADWKAKGPQLAKEHNFTKEEIEEYTAYIELFTKIGK